MKTARIVIGLVVIGILAGLYGGYTIWRPKDNGKADIRELLAKVGDATNRIEKRNQVLVSQVEALKGNAREAEAMKAENRALKGQLDKSVQEMNRLTASMDGLRARASDAERLAEEQRRLKTENAELQGRISALEQENLRLKSVIDNSTEMTKRKEAP